MAARFGDMLLEQRRRMGLSIQQVANTIKIRPQIIEFFETGNFASMPPRGYAQGMISSYARFLGLNPREVVNAYFDDLMAYERETSQQGGRFQDAAGYVNSRSSVDNGRFLMVQGGRSTRYGQRPQQAGYITETGSGEEIRSQRDRFRSTPMPEDRALPAARGVARDPRAGYGDGGYSDRGYRGASMGRSRGGYADADTTQVTPRLRSQSQPYGQRSSAPRSGQRGYQGRSELAPRSGQRSLQGQGGYRGRSDSNRGRMPQGGGRSSSSRGRGGSRTPQNNGLDPRIVYAGIGAVALLLMILGCVGAIVIGNPFLAPVLAIALAMIPFLYLLRTVEQYEEQVKLELETGLSAITSSYERTMNLKNAVEENIDNLKPPVKGLFQSFLVEISVINPDVKAAICHLRERVKDCVWEEWCDTLISCQDDSQLIGTLYPVVEKLTDMRIVNAELKVMISENKREYYIMALMVVANIPLLYFLNKEWYGALP